MAKVYNRHRRLGRDPVDIAVPIAIEHGIADDKYVGFVQTIEQ
jgi:hypothetical protein